jgi:predicted small lipoprotein YifL
MKRAVGILALGVSLLSGLACGRKGPLRPPVGREPQAVRNLTAHQRGVSVVLEWTNPERSLDGRPVGSLEAAEIWTMEVGQGQAVQGLKLKDFEPRARLGRRLAPREWRRVPGPSPGNPLDARFVFPVGEDKFRPRVLAFSIRVLDGKKRFSEFCPPVALHLGLCPLPPEILDARVFEDRIEVAWGPPPANVDGSSPAAVSGYAVYRAQGRGEPEKLTTSPTTALVYVDRNFSFGLPYTYFVRACAAGTEPCVESDDSEAREILPRDIFPPDPPAAVIAVAGTGAISLSWQEGTEEDLAGYRVWRKEAGAAEFVLLTPDLLPGNSYTDASVEKGKVYVYAVSARDKEGNESRRTESGTVSLKGSSA